MHKKNVAYVHDGMFLSREKADALPCAAARVGTEDSPLGALSQTERDKYWVISPARGV